MFEDTGPTEVCIILGPKTLYEGTVIAKISPVSEIASPVSGKIHSKTEFPPYLKDLFEQSVQDLSQY
jgi:hypothetical protein